MKYITVILALLLSSNSYAGCSHQALDELRYMEGSELRSLYCSYYKKEQSHLAVADKYNKMDGAFAIQPMLREAAKAQTCINEKERVNRVMIKEHQERLSDNECY